MEEKIYQITLDDGTKIRDLRLNGNNFISKKKITEALFEDNLYSVIISDGEKEEHHGQMELVQITHTDGEYWFVLIDVPESELRLRKLRADLDYVAMMADADL